MELLLAALMLAGVLWSPAADQWTYETTVDEDTDEVNHAAASQELGQGVQGVQFGFTCSKGGMLIGSALFGNTNHYKPDSVVEVLFDDKPALKPRAFFPVGWTGMPNCVRCLFCNNRVITRESDLRQITKGIMVAELMRLRVDRSVTINIPLTGAKKAVSKMLEACESPPPPLY